MILISSLFILSLQSFFPTSLANRSSSCTPSACGIISNISYPFRLKEAPNNCGDRQYELVCENNVTSFYLNSQKYYVKAINYDNSTFWLVDASINNDDICSFPNSSLYTYRMKNSFSTLNDNQPIHFISCPYPFKNSSLFTDIAHDCASINSSHPRFTYIKAGPMRAFELPEACGLDMIVMTSWKFNDLNNVSLLEIHHSLLHGFDHIFCNIECMTVSYTKWGKFVDFFNARLRRPLLILLVILVLSGTALTPVMTIIGFALVLVLLLTIVHYRFHLRILWWDDNSFDPLGIYAIASTFDPRSTGSEA